MPQLPSDPATRRWWLIGGALVTAAVAAIVWLGLATTVGAVTPTVTGYKVLSDSQVRVEFDVHRPVGTTLDCVVTALDTNHARVGTLAVTIPPSDQASTSTTVLVKTSQRAVTGVVDSCVRR